MVAHHSLWPDRTVSRSVAWIGCGGGPVWHTCLGKVVPMMTMVLDDDGSYMLHLPGHGGPACMIITRF